ncbi:hypothetical protein GW17_00002747 [Ensete ventricosum]|nr:hypothetical protein GW17_00002747 [Ensete ventricosum]
MRQTTLPVFYTRSAVDATGDLSDVASSTRLAARGRRRPRCRSPTLRYVNTHAKENNGRTSLTTSIERTTRQVIALLFFFFDFVSFSRLSCGFTCGLCADFLDARVVNEPLESISMDLGFAGNTLAEGNFHSFCEYLWLIVGLLQRGRIGEAEIEFERLLGLFHVKSAMAELSRSDRGDESESIRYSELFYGRHFRAGPVPGLLLPEIFPNKIRAKAMALCMSVHWVVNFFVGLLFLRLLEQLGAKMLYSMFASFCLMAAIFVGKNVIETKGKSLQEIEISLLSAV